MIVDDCVILSAVYKNLNKVCFTRQTTFLIVFCFGLLDCQLLVFSCRYLLFYTARTHSKSDSKCRDVFVNVSVNNNNSAFEASQTGAAAVWQITDQHPSNINCKPNLLKVLLCLFGFIVSLIVHVFHLFWVLLCLSVAVWRWPVRPVGHFLHELLPYIIINIFKCLYIWFQINVSVLSVIHWSWSRLKWRFRCKLCR